MSQKQLSPTPTPSNHPALESLNELIQTVHRLRAPGGCPWDRAQTHQSLRQYLIEEAYEVLDILDQIHSPDDLKNAKIKNSFREELGDLLMQVLLHSEMTQEVGAFDIGEVAKALNEKLIRRHPHVFGNAMAESEEAALQRWEKEKAKEKAKRVDSSVLEGVPRGLPALQKAARVLEKVTRVGFQWKDLEGPISKVDEEWAELREEINLQEKIKDPLSEEAHLQRKKVESELGDLLFTLCNLGFLLKINPEDALRKTLVRFENRFRYVEGRLKDSEKTPEQSNLDEMDRYWDEAKMREKASVWGLTGGIAAGKSTARRFFAEAGIYVIDADSLAKEMTETKQIVKDAIWDRFGTLDRDQLREIVFRDTQAKQDLEAILHPHIRLESQKRICEAAKNHKVIIYEAALLFEKNRERDFDGIIVVDASNETRLNRLLQRPGIKPETAKLILSSQLPGDKQKENADLIIENNGSLEDLRKIVKKIISDKKWAS